MKKKLILTLMVQTRPEATVEMDTGSGYVKMIPFSGTVDGEFFQGIIEPCGVDTQVTNAAGVRHMSARYMLTGKDMSGNSCHIYVENDGWFTNGERPKPWHSVPRFQTDSLQLKTILESGIFIGEGLRLTEGLQICFYRMED